MPLWDTGVQYGTRAGQPTPNAKQSGTLYFVSDEDVLERWNGSAWQQVATNGAAIETGTYVGDGTAYTRTDLTLGIVAEVVFVQGLPSGGYNVQAWAMRGLYGIRIHETGASANSGQLLVAADGRSFTVDGTGTSGLNESGITFYYVAYGTVA